MSAIPFLNKQFYRGPSSDFSYFTHVQVFFNADTAYLLAILLCDTNILEMKNGL
jgi:hypothetical protein